jgi:hypothetical protein
MRVRLPTAKAGGILTRFMLNDIPGIVRKGHSSQFMFATNMMIKMGSLN